MQTTAPTPSHALPSTPSQGGGPALIISAPCHANAALPAPRQAPRGRSGAAGFTLIELMIAVAVVGVLSSTAYPTFVDQVQRARRSDAIVTVMQLQWAQERWRSNSAAYGNLAEIGMPATSTAGHYTLQVSTPTASGYEVLATATGTQARDTACSRLKLSMQGANPVYSSGPDVSTSNDVATNRRCWSL